MRYSPWRGAQKIWRTNPLPPLFAALCGVAGIVCILFSTLFGVSPLSDWWLYAAQAFLVLMAVIFAAYIVIGIVRDARLI